MFLVLSYTNTPAWLYCLCKRPLKSHEGNDWNSWVWGTKEKSPLMCLNFRHWTKPTSKPWALCIRPGVPSGILHPGCIQPWNHSVSSHKFWFNWSVVRPGPRGSRNSPVILMGNQSGERQSRWAVLQRLLSWRFSLAVTEHVQGKEETRKEGLAETNNVDS